MKMNPLSTAAIIVAGIYLLKKYGSALAKKTVENTIRDVCQELETVTHRDPETIRHFVNALNSKEMPDEIMLPEIERIELAFGRTDNASIMERTLSVVYHEGESMKQRTSKLAVPFDSVPDEIMEQLIRSRENMIIYLLYNKNGEKKK